MKTPLLRRKPLAFLLLMSLLWYPVAVLAQLRGGWERLVTRPQNVPMNGLAMLTPQFGIAVGDLGVMRRTSDSGRTWSSVVLTTHPDLRAVAFVDTMVVVAVGDRGSIARSTDRGMTWRLTTADPVDTLFAVDRTAGSIVVAAGRAGSIVRSTDQGESWESMASGTPATLYDVRIAENGAGIAAGASGTLLVTTDAGASWAPRSSGATVDLRHIEEFGDGTWLVSGNGWTVLTSNDDGATWQRRTIDSAAAAKYPRGNVVLMGFFDRAHGFLIIDERYTPITRTYRTTDGGANWVMGPVKVAVGTRAFASAGGGMGVAVGQYKVGRTRDYGVSWDSIDAFLQTLYHGVAFADSLHGVIAATDDGIVVDKDGNIVAPLANSVDWTTDGGQTWRTTRIRPMMQTTPTLPARLTAIAYPDISLCVAVGDSGLIFRSTDMGATWTRIESGTIYPFVDVSFSDGRNGLAIADSLYRTTNGGRTWKVLDTTITRAYLGGVAAPSADHWVVVSPGENFDGEWQSFVTSNAGASWTIDAVPHEFAQAIFFLDSLVGWSAGPTTTVFNYGAELNDLVFKTTDGGRSWRNLLDRRIGAWPRGLKDVEFADAKHGLAVGNVGKLLISSDGGESWSEQTDPDPEHPDYVGVSYSAPGVAFAVGQWGQLMRYRSDLPSGITSAVHREMPSMIRVTPNPATASVSIGVTLDCGASVSVTIVDALGVKSTEISNQRMAPGTTTIRLDVTNEPAGLYFVRVAIDGKVFAAPLLRSPN